MGKREHGEKGIRILEEFGLKQYHDSIPQIVNYAVLLSEVGKTAEAIKVLQELSNAICEYGSDETMDYAAVQEAIGNICLMKGEVSKAAEHFKKAMVVYEKLFGVESEVIEVKKREVLENYMLGGMYMADK